MPQTDGRTTYDGQISISSALQSRASRANEQSKKNGKKVNKRKPSIEINSNSRPYSYPEHWSRLLVSSICLDFKLPTR